MTRRGAHLREAWQVLFSLSLLGWVWALEWLGIKRESLASQLPLLSRVLHSKIFEVADISCLATGNLQSLGTTPNSNQKSPNTNFRRIRAITVEDENRMICLLRQAALQSP
jgi:hypothetical protein